MKNFMKMYIEQLTQDVTEAKEALEDAKAVEHDDIDAMGFKKW